MTFGADRPIVA